MSQKKIDQIKDYFNDGNRHLNGGRNTEAINSYLSALFEVRDEHIINSTSEFLGSFGMVGPKEYEGMLLHSIGVACKNLGDIDNAHSYKQKALSVFEAVGTSSASSKATRVARELEELELLRIISRI